MTKTSCAATLSAVGNRPSHVTRGIQSNGVIETQRASCGSRTPMIRTAPAINPEAISGVAPGRNFFIGYSCCPLALLFSRSPPTRGERWFRARWRQEHHDHHHEKHYLGKGQFFHSIVSTPGFIAWSSIDRSIHGGVIETAPKRMILRISFICQWEYCALQEFLMAILPGSHRPCGSDAALA